MREKYRDPLHILLECTTEVSVASYAISPVRDNTDPGKNMDDEAGATMPHGPRSRRRLGTNLQSR